MTASRFRYAWALPLVIAVAAGLRFFGLGHGISFHPDERHIVMVTQGLHWGDMSPRFFAYGSFPMYLLWALAQVLGRAHGYLGGYDGMFWIGRVVSALAGTLTVAMTYRLARECGYRSKVALVAAAILAANVFHIQLSHFYAVDVLLTALTTAALLAILRTISADGTWRMLVAAFFVGTATATKVSALALLAPLGVAWLGARARSRAWWSPTAIGRLGLGLVAIAAVFLVFEPYAALDYATFRANMREQGNMAWGRSEPVYVIQYAGTAPYLYPLQQILEYTVGWPAGLAMLLGTLWVGGRALRGQARAEHLVLLAWVIPTFVLVGAFQVKFPRYLLPLYPCLAVFAADALERVGRGLARLWPSRKQALRGLPNWLILVPAGAYALAFMNLYTQEHVWFQASRWMYGRLPWGAAILGEHWDDKLPLHLRGGETPARYRTGGREWELPLYEPDAVAKLRGVADKLATADFIALPTARLYGSILGVADRYPDTSRYYRLLFDGALGYELVQTFKVSPALGPLVFSDELADESFTVYDHPKVCIFKNRDRLSAEELYARIGPGGSPVSRPSRAEILQARSGATVTLPAAPGVLASLIRWLFVLEVLGLLAYPLVATGFRDAPDRGYGIAKIVGVVVTGYLSWLLAWCGAFPATGPVFALCVLALGGAGNYAAQRWWGGWRRVLGAGGRHLVAAESVFLGGFVVFALIRSFHPEIYWGEKPMDFTFLNYFARLEHLPPNDPWAAGREMHYYYFGTYLLAQLLKVTSIAPGVGYNLAIASVAAWLLAACYTAVVAITRGHRVALFGAAAVVMSADFDVLYRWLVEKKPLGFDLFWASSRVLTSPAITEYPLWSLLFADLHAHVIALPVAAALVACAMRTATASAAMTEDRLSRCALFGITALLWGSLLGINTWDFLSYGFVLLVAHVYAAPGYGWETGPVHVGPTRGVKQIPGMGRSLLWAAALAVAAVVCYLPLFASLRGGGGGGASFSVSREGLDELQQVARVLGHWWLLVGAAALGLLGARVRAGVAMGRAVWWRAAGVGVLPVAIAAASWAQADVALPWGIFVATGVLAAVGSVLADSGGASRRSLRAAGALIVCTALLTALAERFVLIDRMNTIFKCYNAIWMLLAIAAAGLLGMWLERLPAGGVRIAPRRAPIRGLLGVAALVVGAMAAGSVVDIGIMVTHRRVDGPRPTLDGLAYLEGLRPGEAGLVSWVNRTVPGTPVLLEAQGRSYGDHTRLAMYTGLQTVLGWDHHVKQRGTPAEEVRRRAQDITLAYTSSDPEDAAAVIDKYGVDFVAVGWLERREYPEEGLAKFAAATDLFVPVYRRDDDVLYATRRAWSVTASRAAAELLDSAPEGGGVSGDGGVSSASATAGLATRQGARHHGWLDAGALGSKPIALASGRGEVLVYDAAAGQVRRIGRDGKRNRVLEFVPPEELENTEALAFGGNGKSLWALATDPSRLLRISLDEEALTTYPWPTGDAPARPSSLSVDEAGGVWVLDAEGSALWKLAATAGKAAGEGAVAEAEATWRRVLGPEVLGDSRPTAVSTGSGTIWLTSGRTPELLRFDPRGNLLGRSRYQQRFLPGLPPSPRVAATGTGALVAGIGVDGVIELDERGSIVRTLTGDWILPCEIAVLADASGTADAAVVLDVVAGVAHKVGLPSGKRLLSGVEGPAPGDFREPRGIARGPDGSIYVVDMRNFRIQRFAADGRFLDAWGAEGEAVGKFKDATGLAVTSDGFVLVADTWNHRIQKLDATGRMLGVFADGFYGPRDVKEGPDGTVYVSDTGNGKVVVFARSGTRLREIGERGDADGLMRDPIGLAVRGDTVFVADAGNARVQVFTSGGAFVRRWPVDGWVREGIREPYLGLDRHGHLVLAVAATHELRVYGDDGTLVDSIPVPSLGFPTGLAVLPEEHAVLVADAQGHRIQKVTLTHP
ncbi:MAG: glycosyltransferase family 39 protein [Candidatus Schekmanbacteria bacterium]|nr:glycosyltransferase family 39 protein [Candidatus Schekmanbacteria bacterium]